MFIMKLSVKIFATKGNLIPEPDTHRSSPYK